MSLRLSPLIAIMLLVSGIQTARAGDGCMPPEREPTIRVDVIANNPTIDHGRARFELKGFDTATVSPYGADQQVHVNGLMRGAITLETQSSIAWQQRKDGEDNCFWFDGINIVLRLNPVIYVAHEIAKDTCLYNEVLNHEMKHFNVDVETAKDYQVLLQDELERFIHQTGIIGPFSSTQREEARNSLTTRLEATVRAINDRMNFERVKRQSVVDTREEYERIARACPTDTSML